MKNFYIMQTLTITGGGGDAVEIEVETEVEVEYHIEPAQNGGREDPSWPAHAVIEGATRAEDLVIGGVTVARSGEDVHIGGDQRCDIEREMLEYLDEP